MFNFGVAVRAAHARSADLQGRAAAGGCTTSSRCTLPLPVMNHDFALTDEAHGVRDRPDRRQLRPRACSGFSSFGESLRWDPSKPTQIVLVPRDGGKPRMVESEPVLPLPRQQRLRGRRRHGRRPRPLRRLQHRLATRCASSGPAASTSPRRSGGCASSPTARSSRTSSARCEGEFPQHDWRRTHDRGTATPTWRAASGGDRSRAGSSRSTTTASSWAAHDFGEGQVAGEPIFVPRSPDSGRGRRLAADGRLLGGRAPLAAGRARRARRRGGRRSRWRTCATTCRSASTAPGPSRVAATA